MSYITVQGSDIAITNPEKLLWHGIGIRKIDYIRALIELAPYLIPHTADKALTAIRYPDGIGQSSFYQKRPPKNTPEWVDTVTVNGDTFIHLSSLKTLVWLGNLAAIEFHTPFCDAADETLHALVFDLDPSERQTFEAAAACALDVHDTLSGLGITCYAKTSGATGLQVYVPTKRMSFEQGRRLNAFFGEYFAAKHPDTVTIERSVKNRGGKLYFDYLQMAGGKSIISVYSPRAVPCGAISMPVTWDELKRMAYLHAISILRMRGRGSERVGDLV